MVSVRPPPPHALSTQKFRGQGVHLRFGSGCRDVGRAKERTGKGDEGGSPKQTGGNLTGGGF